MPTRDEKVHVQLLAKGKQDEQLYDSYGLDPFRPTNVTHSPFAIERVPTDLQNVRPGRTVRIPLVEPEAAAHQTNYVGVRGDVLGSLMMEVRLPRIVSKHVAGWANAIGWALFRSIELEIDHVTVDRWDDRMMDVHHELHDASPRGLARLVEKYESDHGALGLGSDGERTVYVPLPFRFGHGDRPYLPWGAIRHSEVCLIVTMAPLVDLLQFDDDADLDVQILPSGPGVSVVFGTPSTSWVAYDDSPAEPFAEWKARLWVESFTLSSQEATILKAVTHDVLFETHGAYEFAVPAGSRTFTVDLRDEGIRSSLPTKEWILVFQTGTQPHRYRYAVDVAPKRAWFTLNEQRVGHVAGGDRDEEGRMRWVHPFDRYAAISNKPIYVLPFALSPSKYQPTGSFTFSKFRSSKLTVEFRAPIPEPYRLSLFATRYGLIHIEGGTAHLQRL